jgi:signal transduction histidine kinase
MWDKVRVTDGGHCGLSRGRKLPAAAVTAGFLAFSAPARAENTALQHFEGLIDALTTLERHETSVLVLMFGLLLFVVMATTVLVRIRLRASSTETALRDRIAALRADRDRFHALLMSEQQILVAWAAAEDRPSILGEITLVTAPSEPQRVLAFGAWLDPVQAQAMEQAVGALRARGEGFTMQLMTLAGRAIQSDGRATGGLAVLRLRDVNGIKRELAELQARHDMLASQNDSLRALIDALPSPVWTRDAEGALVHVNNAYARSVEAKDPSDAIARSMEFLNQSTRDEVSRARAAGNVYTGRIPAIVEGQRRCFDVFDVPATSGSAGIGIDATEAETMRGELNRVSDAHRRTLDQLATGVAIFTANQRLAFYNAAYRALWELDGGFLDQNPTDSAVLDQLRAARRLPEEQDFRQWKAVLHEAYRATEAKEHLWHLPDGRALRVVTTPNPQGGVTYLFEDVTERLDLVRRYDALIRVQGETLDNLAEAVAVFGSDGRLRLHNPAFASMWQLAPDALSDRPHIETVIDRCRPLHGDETLWKRLRTKVTAIEGRDSVTGRIERGDGSVIDLATVPLPDGATLVTFLDVTDTINVERALRERNEALETADALKVDFVHHVSYELRSPLTNIIGFTHFLGEPSTGPLNSKQLEYLGYINTSTNALLAIINDILDLATIDAGAMKLNLGPVDIRQAMHAAAAGIEDRLVKDDLTLDIKPAANIGSFVADERRIRQILFNLLANAVGFSPPGAVITLSAVRNSHSIVFTVTDNGPGIPPNVKDRVFNWFESHPLGSRHRGAGLGLSIVRSFVELHGGTVTLDSTVGQGTTAVCTFPLDVPAEQTAA